MLNGETVIINETSQGVKTVRDVTIKKILKPEGKGLIIKIDGVLSLPKLSY